MAKQKEQKPTFLLHSEMVIDDVWTWDLFFPPKGVVEIEEEDG